MSAAPAIDGLDRRVVPFDDGPTAHDALLQLVGDRRIVLLGEASHGSAEFYRERDWNERSG